ncbi:hypothetical protein QT17_11435 [Thermus sp. 2.9]|uniref:DUF4129 domain-containing protein n=1 Tax=Thermus sp. (strain 2.9) TaxID=1577051 RepID=UPI0005423DA4|nr:DUF4129 domain-containing protein [Thermus sp. 2.9]KHG64566.1 hypothetical protein QT17_11435 [Thermus sp. 2.9]
MGPILAALILLLAAPPFGTSLALGVGLLLLAQRFSPTGFLGWAFLPGLLQAFGKPLASWLSEWAWVSFFLLLYGLFLAAQGRPWASFFLLPPALFLGPGGLFLLGVLHGVSLLEGARAQAQARGEAFQAPPHALAIPFLLGLSLGGLASFTLPHLPLPSLPEVRFPTPSGVHGPPEGGVVYGAPEGGLPLWALWLNRLLPHAHSLALLLLLFALVPLLGRGERLPYRGVHLLPLLLALLAGGLFLLFLGTLGGGERGPAQATFSGSSPLLEPSPTTSIPGPRRMAEAGLALAGLSALLTLALLLALALFLWRGRFLAGAKGEATPSPWRPRALRRTLPQDRVRRAYLHALKALGQAGFPRLPPEGPLEYARRVRGLFPRVEAPLEGLTRLYLPVRYGEGLGEESAQEAEAYLADILRLCSSNGSKKP